MITLPALARPAVARTLARTALAALLAGLLAGCAATGPRDVQQVNPADVPFGLLSTSPSAGSSTSSHGPLATIYLIQSGHLARVSATAVGVNQPADDVRALLRAPTQDQTAAGLSSAIPSQTRLVSLDVTGTTAIVDLNSAFGDLGGAQQILAVAQIVYTLTETPAITAVRFAINDTPIDVPDGSGSLTSGARVRGDYQQVATR